MNFEVEECVRRAMIAQKEWSRTSFDERRAVLNDFIEMVLCNQEDICVASMNDTGKTSQYPLLFLSFFQDVIYIYMYLCDQMKTCIIMSDEKRIKRRTIDF